MPKFTVTVPGTVSEPLTDDRLDKFRTSLTRHLVATYVRDGQHGTFEVIAEVVEETQNLAESLARLVTVCALFECGHSCLTSSIDEAGITSRPS